MFRCDVIATFVDPFRSGHRLLFDLVLHRPNGMAHFPVHALRTRGKLYGLQTMCEGGISNVTIIEAALDGRTSASITLRLKAASLLSTQPLPARERARFLLELIAQLQAIGTAPMLDLRAYSGMI